MKLPLLVSLLLLSSFTLWAQQETYSRVKVSLQNSTQNQQITQKGVANDHIFWLDKTHFLGEFSQREIANMRTTGAEVEILMEDVAKFYAERNHNLKVNQTSATSFNYGSMGGFLTFDEAVLELDSLAMQYPNWVTSKTSIGTSVEGRPIWMLKISDNPNVDENEPEALFIALHHAREAVTVSQLIFFMQYLVENEATDPTVHFLLQNRELYFVPIMNPDGYVYNQMTNPLGGGMWRKNRKDNLDGTFGVDLNRNYGYQWGDSSGSSPNSIDNTYRGLAPFSEPETQAIRDFCIARHFKTHLSSHSYGNYLIYPWGYDSSVTNDDALFQERASIMTGQNAYIYGTSVQTVNYSVSGGSDDWMYGDVVAKPKMMGYTSESGYFNDGFWPDITRILPICNDMILPNIYTAMFASEYVETSVSNGMNFTTLNVGLPTTVQNLSPLASDSVALSFVSTSPYVLASTSVKYASLVPNIPYSSNLPIILASTTPTSTLIQGKIRTTFVDGYYIDTDANFVYNGMSAIQNLSVFTDYCLYPNPSKERNFTLAKGNAGSEKATIWIMDMNGNRVLKEEAMDKINLEKLSAGIYFYYFESAKGERSIAKKLVLY